MPGQHAHFLATTSLRTALIATVSIKKITDYPTTRHNDAHAQQIGCDASLVHNANRQGKQITHQSPSFKCFPVKTHCPHVPRTRWVMLASQRDLPNRMVLSPDSILNTRRL